MTSSLIAYYLYFYISEVVRLHLQYSLGNGERVLNQLPVGQVEVLYICILLLPGSKVAPTSSFEHVQIFVTGNAPMTWDCSAISL